jgi:hypothetical protein
MTLVSPSRISRTAPDECRARSGRRAIADQSTRTRSPGMLREDNLTRAHRADMLPNGTINSGTIEGLAKASFGLLVSFELFLASFDFSSKAIAKDCQ